MGLGVIGVQIWWGFYFGGSLILVGFLLILVGFNFGVVLMLMGSEFWWALYFGGAFILVRLVFKH